MVLVLFGDDDAAVASDCRGAFLTNDDGAPAAHRPALDVDFLAGDHVAIPADCGIAFFAADHGPAAAGRGVAIFGGGRRAARPRRYRAVLARGDGAAPAGAHLRRESAPGRPS